MYPQFFVIKNLSDTHFGTLFAYTEAQPIKTQSVSNPRLKFVGLTRNEPRRMGGCTGM